jgi:hypothetical protein
VGLRACNHEVWRSDPGKEQWDSGTIWNCLCDVSAHLSPAMNLVCRARLAWELNSGSARVISSMRIMRILPR